MPRHALSVRPSALGQSDDACFSLSRSVAPRATSEHYSLGIAMLEHCCFLCGAATPPPALHIRRAKALPCLKAALEARVALLSAGIMPSAPFAIFAIAPLNAPVLWRK